MAHSTDNTERWGGPGSSDQNRDKPKPDPTVKDRDDPDHYSRHSKVSGGGGETDVHHAHDASRKADFEAGDAEKRKN